MLVRFVTSKTKSNHVTAMTAAKRHDDLMIISTERSGNVKRLNVSITRSLMIAVGVADMLERNESEKDLPRSVNIKKLGTLSGHNDDPSRRNQSFYFESSVQNCGNELSTSRSGPAHLAGPDRPMDLLGRLHCTASWRLDETEHKPRWHPLASPVSASGPNPSKLDPLLPNPSSYARLASILQCSTSEALRRKLHR
ncbi:uncharacterized protein LOC120430162 [Culex pipiens pallens]|uniref:uncharacterized protein LOC120430162 n=1 Tax=Culex pipiens pallens TaxID=42434 RepID=UPI0019539B8D|nr:uncharacterized protein LOC120430162 [Culex pipiens pallens]